MRVSAIVVLVVATVISGGAVAGQWLPDEPKGGQFVDTKRPKEGKDYYVVRKGDSGQCSVVPGQWNQKPDNVVGSKPYVSRAYASAALKTFAECKGGEDTENAGDTKHGKHRDHS